MLGLTLLSLHNVYFFLDLMRKIREAIADNSFGEFKRELLGNYNGG
jgi:queuine tRNA-ribosyltransferase